ncbi:helix-turn-helix domain-containing protein [Streptomyces sp. NPDC006367]|uniref:helix-turn-helix domain-containing protein n=1 Tax=unclassified Streptomyces TaxID=2593676 RepID=UPI0033B31166
MNHFPSGAHDHDHEPLPGDDRPHKRCPIPSVPHLATGALLRYYRVQGNWSYQRVQERTGISDRRLHGIELARRPLEEDVARTLLDIYGAGQEAQAAAALLSGGHVHEARDQVFQRGSWVMALKAAAQEAVLLSTGPLRLACDLAAPAAPTPGRAQYRCRTLLLLHEPALHRTSVQQLARLIALVERRSLTVRLVPGGLSVPEGLLTEWSLTAGISDTSAAECQRRQLYVTHIPGQAPWARNGEPAHPERQLIQLAALRARTPLDSVHQLRQATVRPRIWTTGGGKSPARSASADPAARRLA